MNHSDKLTTERNYIVNATRFLDRKAIHETIRETIGTEDYFGNRLDALADKITSMRFDFTLKIIHTSEIPKEMGYYTNALKEMLSQLQIDNPHLHFLWED